MAQEPVGRLALVPLLPDPAFQYQKPLPDYLLALSPKGQPPVTNEGAALGRVLFYDLKLSKNGLVSCASCHSQVLGFDDPTKFSIGFEGKITRRHAMGLANGRFNKSGRFFWDERAATLEEQVLQPFFDPIEMGLSEGELTAKIRGIDYYAPLFENAFGDGDVTKQRIAHALSQFVRSMVSDQSFYDIERRKYESAEQEFSGFTNVQNRGKFLFFNSVSAGGAGCGSCHESDAFIMQGPRNNGLDAVSTDDQGWGEVSGKQEDIGKFRAASLKNIALRAPYMHDGRFPTLAGVIDHYASGIQPHTNLDPLLQNLDGTPKKIKLSRNDKLALLTFLGTLSDREFVSAPRFSNPFRY
ncbi:MAG: cytochrome c peroxidase [Rhizobiaceae bacterium]